MLAEGVRWFNDWFAIEEIAPGIRAIGEPRFHQLNWNYLIEGNDKALLFDTGPGVRDISKPLTLATAEALLLGLMRTHESSAHGQSDVGGNHRAPVLARDDASHLAKALQALKTSGGRRNPGL